MSSSTRRAIQGRQPQGIGEEIAYSLTTTPWGSSPTLASFAVLDITTALPGTDVTSTVAPGTPTVAGDVITTPLIQDLTVGHIYRVELGFRCGSQKFVAWFELEAEY